MPEPPKSANGRAKATVARSFNRTAQRTSLRAANFARKNPNAKKVSRGAKGAIGRGLNASASRASRTAYNYAKKNNPNLTKRVKKGKLATKASNARTRGQR